MKKLLGIVVLGLLFFDISYASAKSLTKKESKKFVLNHAITLKDERKDGVVTYIFGEENYEWSILAAGKHQMSFVTTGAILGGNVRVGLEDSLFLGKGEMAKSNAEQVAKIRRIIEDMSLEVATPTEARERLALKGGDNVSF